jgi:peptidoglycan/xylan/chitin deacetylase (PgdA/CDA1 family)
MLRRNRGLPHSDSHISEKTDEASGLEKFIKSSELFVTNFVSIKVVRQEGVMTMKKIIFAFLLLFAAVLCACNNSSEDIEYPPQTSADTEVTTTQPQTTPLPETEETTAQPPVVTEELPEYTVDPDKPMVAITFDDGPNGKTTERIVEILEQNGARATFFVVGSRVAGENQRSAMQKALDANCEIGCHSYSHPRMWDLDIESMNKQIEDCIAAIDGLVDTEVKYFRPTGGNLPDFVYECEYPLILWSVDPEDWRNRDKDMICQNIKDNVFGGCIILMHDLYQATADACEEIIPWLAEQGYQMVTVSELFEARGITPENGEVWGRVRKSE